MDKAKLGARCLRLGDHGPQPLNIEPSGTEGGLDRFLRSDKAGAGFDRLGSHLVDDCLQRPYLVG